MAFSEVQLIPGAGQLRPVLSTFLGQNDVFDVTITGDDGNPLDLTPYIDDYDGSEPFEPEDCKNRAVPITTGAYLFVRDYVGEVPATFQSQLEITDPTAGKVQIHFDTCDFRCPGLFLGDISLIKDGAVEHTFLIYVEVNVKLNWNLATEPISIAEVRLWARDNSGLDNFLLDEVEYKDAEVAAAIRRGVDMFNSAVPQLRRFTFRTKDFPYRHEWINVTIGLLQEMVAHGYLRNHLTYSAEGLTIDDKRHKYVFYTAESQRRLNEYKAWVQMAKVQLNAGQAVGRLGLFRLP